MKQPTLAKQELQYIIENLLLQICFSHINVVNSFLEHILAITAVLLVRVKVLVAYLVFYCGFTGAHRMNYTQLYQWLINEGINEEDTKKLRGIV